MAQSWKAAMQRSLQFTTPRCRHYHIYCRSAHVGARCTAHAAHEVDGIQAVPVPLCYREASHVESVSSVVRWRHTVTDRIKELKDGFESTDGGPASSELQREVNWVLDDAVSAFREHEQQQWLCCTWQQLQSELQSAARRSKDTSQWQVQLRAPVEQLEQLWKLRLQDRVPFQYLIHTAHWRDLILSVGPGILVPRPETEVMIDLAARAIAANPALAAAPWADLGTGSGAIAIGTAKLLQQQQQRRVSDAQVKQQQPCTEQPSTSRVFAVDLSSTAVAYAAGNAARCGVQDAVKVLQGSWFEPLQEHKGQLGGVLSNPPYIPRVQMDGLQAEVGKHEPWSALDGGPEAGLDSLQVICDGAASMLMPGGFLALETAGAQQAPLVKELLEAQRLDGAAAFVDVEIVDDCFGVPRFVTATRSR